MLRVGDGYLLSEYVWKVIRVGDDDDECLFDVGQLSRLHHGILNCPCFSWSTELSCVRWYRCGDIRRTDGRKCAFRTREGDYSDLDSDSLKIKIDSFRRD